MHLRWSTGDVADAVLTTHRTAVGNFDLETLDFLGEFDTLRIGERFALLVDIPNVQYLAHELDDRLCFVESRGRNYGVGRGEVQVVQGSKW